MNNTHIEIFNEIPKNRLILRIIGSMSYEESLIAVKKVRDLANQLKSGFDIINDISQFMPSDPKVQQEFMETQKYVMSKGAKRVVRVVGSALGSLQFKRLHKEAGVSYEVIEATTFEAAVKYLDENP